jgi:hypothetical protein
MAAVDRSAFQEIYPIGLVTSLPIISEKGRWKEEAGLLQDVAASSLTAPDSA